MAAVRAFILGILLLDVVGHGYGQVQKDLPPIGRSSYEMILHHEVSSRRFYDEIYEKPCVPGEDSGVTIGIGYDLGQTTKERFYRAWGNLLPQHELELLAACIGLKRGSARRALPSVINIRIPWEKAEKVFQTHSLPDAIAATLIAFPGAHSLPPDGFGTLVSLVFNRGGNVFDTTGSTRRKEMMQIRQLLASRQFGQIPDAIRSMKRIWQGKGVPGLLRRREDEAKLLELVLNNAPLNNNYFDTNPKDLKANPVLRNQPMTQFAQAVTLPMTQVGAEELRAYLFQNASIVASSLSARIESMGNRQLVILRMAEVEDMRWASEFRDLIVRDEKGGRVFENKELGKFVKVDLTELDFSEYPPSEVNRILELTQNLMRIQVPSPLLAQWSGDAQQLPIGSKVHEENVVNYGKVKYN